MLANEIEEVLQYSENQQNKKNNNRKYPKDSNLERMALIKNNIPNVRNTKKGMLKQKDKELKKDKMEK